MIHILHSFNNGNNDTDGCYLCNTELAYCTVYKSDKQVTATVYKEYKNDT